MLHVKKKTHSFSVLRASALRLKSVCPYLVNGQILQKTQQLPRLLKRHCALSTKPKLILVLEN